MNDDDKEQQSKEAEEKKNSPRRNEELAFATTLCMCLCVGTKYKTSYLIHNKSQFKLDYYYGLMRLR